MSSTDVVSVIRHHIRFTKSPREDEKEFMIKVKEIASENAGRKKEESASLHSLNSPH